MSICHHTISYILYQLSYPGKDDWLASCIYETNTTAYVFLKRGREGEGSFFPVMQSTPCATTSRKWLWPVLAWRFYSFPSVLTSCKRPLDACAWFSLFGAYTTPLTVYDDVSVTTWNYKYTSVTQKLQSINSLPIVDVSGPLLEGDHLP